MATKRKLAAAAVAVATSAALLLGGTFAWQSISQTALNEASDVINPGGRLHDDFYIDANGDYNADIYVENFAEDEIFARVRLEEYMEVVINYGTNAESRQTLVGSQAEVDTDSVNIVYDKAGNPLYERNYVRYHFDNNEVADAGGAATGNYSAAIDGDAKSWFRWTPGSSSSETVYYMPTFNMNKDSLVADRNGMYVDRIGGISNRGPEQYEDWTVWADGDTKSDTEIHDVDPNTADEVGYAFENLATFVDAGNIATKAETHEARQVGHTNGLISMADWLTLLNNSEDTDNYWVYDTDGWVYWSSPIAAESATGLLLDSIELNQVMDDTWYYAINVIGQFVTPDDIGEADGTGFYENEAEKPSDDAKTLLEHISTGVSDGDQEEEDPEQVYDMHVYITGADYRNYLVPDVAYNLEVAAAANDYGDMDVTLSIIDEIGRKLTPGEDYEFGSATVKFEDYSGNYGDSYAKSAITTLRILNEDLVGTYVTIIAEADQTGNTGSTEVSINYERLDVEITLYAEGENTPVAGTNHGATIDPNSIYDIVASISGQGGTEYVIYSTLEDQPVSSNIEVPGVYAYAHAGEYYENNYINEQGQLVVGEAKTFDCNEWMDDGITNLDTLTLAIGADVVRVYENVDAKNSGAEPTEIYYTYGQWDLFPTNQEVYEIGVGDMTAGTPQTINVYDGNWTRDITSEVTLAINGATDTTGTKIEKVDATDGQNAYWQLVIGENETAETLTIKAYDESGSGSQTIHVTYPNKLFIGEESSNSSKYIWIYSSDETTSAALSLRDYWGNPIADVTYGVYDYTSEDTWVEGSTLYIGAHEAGSPMIITANGDEYHVYVINREPSVDTTAPVVSVGESIEA